MSKRIVSVFLSVALLCCLLSVGTAVNAANSTAGSQFLLTHTSLGIDKSVYSKGRYENWAGVSTVCQFLDEKGNLCFAVQEDGKAAVYKIENGTAKRVFSVPIGVGDRPGILGTAVCDQSGNYYIVWGAVNSGDDTAVQTIFVSKIKADGSLSTTVGGDGSESLAYYYPASYHTKTPFDGGNCDAAINGDLLMVNYARKMYSGHQSNSVLVININTMQLTGELVDYNSHSFDQRVTPYSKTGGFLLESHGDCFSRNFTTAVTNANGRSLGEFNGFDFWVSQGAYDKYDMWELNRTYARLGNILETGRGAALIGSSARSLSESAKNEPYDVFIQVFDPTGDPSDPSSFVTSGERSGYAGMNGDTYVTNYGVKWLTDFAGTGLSADVVQAISTDDDRIVVLYETAENGGTYCMLLGADGTVIQDATYLGNVRLNVDEDPVFSHGAVQWLTNENGSSELVLYSLQVCSGVPGDLTNNGEVDSDDLTALARIVAKIDDATALQRLAADVTHDGNVDSDDLTKLAQYVARIIDAF